MPTCDLCNKESSWDHVRDYGGHHPACHDEMKRRLGSNKCYKCGISDRNNGNMLMCYRCIDRGANAEMMDYPGPD